MSCAGLSPQLEAIGEPALIPPLSPELIPGSDFVGAVVETPHTEYAAPVRVLPLPAAGLRQSMVATGTGFSMCVPAASPVDFVSVRELRMRSEVRAALGVSEEWLPDEDRAPIVLKVCSHRLPRCMCSGASTKVTAIPGWVVHPPPPLLPRGEYGLFSRFWRPAPSSQYRKTRREILLATSVSAYVTNRLPSFPSPPRCPHQLPEDTAQTVANACALAKAFSPADRDELVDAQLLLGPVDSAEIALGPYAGQRATVARPTIFADLVSAGWAIPFGDDGHAVAPAAVIAAAKRAAGARKVATGSSIGGRGGGNGKETTADGGIRIPVMLRRFLLGYYIVRLRFRFYLHSTPVGAAEEKEEEAGKTQRERERGGKGARGGYERPTANSAHFIYGSPGNSRDSAGLRGVLGTSQMPEKARDSAKYRFGASEQPVPHGPLLIANQVPYTCTPKAYVPPRMHGRPSAGNGYRISRNTRDGKPGTTNEDTKFPDSRESRESM